MSYPYLQSSTSSNSGDSSQVPVDALTLGLKWSLIGHFLLFFLILIKSLIFPSRAVPYVSTLKVDLVALPDVLKKDLANPSHSQFDKEISKLLKQVQQEAKRTEVSERPTKHHEPLAKKEEMLLHPKPHGEKGVEKRNLRALERIKAFSKIQASSEDDTEHDNKPIRGNKISPGTSLSGEAKEANLASYYDTLRDRLKENFTLPVWISRQDLAAQVLLFIDAHGKLQSFKFQKPSGNVQFDDAVKRTIQLSQPFPFPPKELTGSLLSDGILVGFPL